MTRKVQRLLGGNEGRLVVYNILRKSNKVVQLLSAKLEYSAGAKVLDTLRLDPHISKIKNPNNFRVESPITTRHNYYVYKSSFNDVFISERTQICAIPGGLLWP